MGRSYVSLMRNGANRNTLKKAYELLKKKGYDKIIEASEIGYFQYLPFPPFDEVIDIEIGTDGTKSSIVWLKNDGYIMFKGIIKYRTLIKKW